MKASVYEIIQKRKELLKDLENLRDDRNEKAVEKRKIDEKESVENLSLKQYNRRRKELVKKITKVTVALRKQNVEEEITELGMNPEEARLKRDMLDKEINALRNLTETSETSYLSSDDIVKVSRIEDDELDQLIHELTEKRGRLDTELQKFNLNTEMEVDI